MVKGRIAEILLQQMIEGTVPTKVNKRRDGGVKAVFDMLGAC